MERNYSIDSIKFFAALAVVTIHTQPFISNNVIFIFIRTICSFAVPTFFISSGYFLAKGIISSKDSKKYIKRYMSKILCILIISILLYTLYNILKFLISSNFKQNIIQFLNGILIFKNLYYGIDEGGMYHLWYLFSILYIIPIIFIFRNKINLLLKVAFTFNLVGIAIQLIGLEINVRDALFYGLFYMTLGYWIFVNETDILYKIRKLDEKHLTILFFIFNLVQILESYMIKRFTYSFVTIGVVTVLFLKLIKNKLILKDSWLNRVGTMSLGIYIIHPMVIDSMYLVINKISVENIVNTIWWQLLIAPVVFTISFVMYNIINTIKKLYYNDKILNKAKF